MRMPFVAGVDIVAGVAIVVAHPLARQVIVVHGDILRLLPALITIRITMNSYAMITILVATLKGLGVGTSHRKGDAGYRYRGSAT